MARVSIEERAYFECPTCGNESQTSPDASKGKSVVCEFCGATHRVADKSYMAVDWNKRNREIAKSNRG